MNSQKEIFPYIGGVLLLYEELGIHVIEVANKIIYITSKSNLL